MNTLTWGLAAAVILVVGLAVWWRGQSRARQQREQQSAEREQRLLQEAAAVKAAADARAREQAEAQKKAEAERQAEAARATAEKAAEKAAALAAELAAAEAAAFAQAQAIAQAAAESARREAAEKAAAEAQARARAAAEQAAAEAEARRVAETAAAAETARRQAAEHAAAEQARAAAAVPATPAAQRRPEDTLVMVADDSKVVRVKTSRLLAGRGYRVVLAEDGAQAAQLLESELPAVLITDVEMPGMDGFELTRHVRAHPRARAIPIIMITSADDRLKQAAAEAGVTLVLGKPYPEEELIACIERSQLATSA